ncbi:MAG: THUMP domain-containing class I SAM-dependent RNA methyltransferase [Flavobacteriales bacterium]|jgi:putative N6-adenine-specific DNA methylase|tara:strand:- start:27 stop:1190 length:1164 start_codon:yes stop_codon:yes gene_type:complete
MSNDFKIIAKTFFGFESILADELLKLGAKKIEIGVRNVSFYGDIGFLYKANLSLRTAIRILKPIKTFQINDEKDLYSSVFNFNWEDYISIDNSFSIESVLNTDFFSHTLYVSQRVKDGIVDRFRKLFGKRPNVDLEDPDIKINIHISQNTCTISLDSSGKPLNQRGYRSQTNIAPINEVLAAGIVILSNWDCESDLLDPMCGSGTLLIEAAMYATNYPVNIKRNGFLFQNWNDWDSDLFEMIKTSVLNKVKSFDYKIIGYDKAPSAVLKCKQNILNSGFEDIIEVCENDFFNTKKTNDQFLHLLFNPPYGERLKIDIQLFYKQIGDTLKSNYANSNAWFITSSLEALKYVGLRPSRKIKLYNGKLESRLAKYEIYSGSKKTHKQSKK